MTAPTTWPRAQPSNHRTRDGVAAILALPGDCGEHCGICNGTFDPRVDTYRHIPGETPTIYDPPGDDPYP